MLNALFPFIYITTLIVLLVQAFRMMRLALSRGVKRCFTIRTPASCSARILSTSSGHCKWDAGCLQDIHWVPFRADEWGERKGQTSDPGPDCAAFCSARNQVATGVRYRDRYDDGKTTNGFASGDPHCGLVIDNFLMKTCMDAAPPGSSWEWVQENFPLQRIPF